MNPLSFSVGGLLYSPANNTDVADHVLRQDWPGLTSLCLCLEDAILDTAVEQAEAILGDTLEALGEGAAPLPLLFVRVKSPAHLARVRRLLGGRGDILTGYVFPKFDLSNAEAYLEELFRANAQRREPLYAMPILESLPIACASTRRESLAGIRTILDGSRERILNVRVGGNDFCNLFRLRRTVRQSIYDLGVVRDILVDIVSIFSHEYVVSGPVWEYYGAPGGEWETGLRRELELDIANGFFGKTAIHPSQLPVIGDSLKVSALDLADARQILNWSDDRKAVAGSAAGGRMNEVKCHGRWAERVMLRAELYGVRKEA